MRRIVENTAARGPRFLSGVAVSVVTAFALGCSEPDDGSVRGELRVYNVTYPDGRVEQEYFLSPNAESQEITELLFAEPPRLAPWTRLKVWGVTRGRRFEVIRWEVDEDATESIATVSEELLMGPQRTRTAALVLINTGAGVNI